MAGSTVAVQILLVGQSSVAMFFMITAFSSVVTIVQEEGTDWLRLYVVKCLHRLLLTFLQ